MTKEQWQELYDDLYSYNHHFKRLTNDLFYNTDLSKKRNGEIKLEVDAIMSKTYFRITHNDIFLKLFENGVNGNELKNNKYDLKNINQLDYVLDSFLFDLDKYINALG